MNLPRVLPAALASLLCACVVTVGQTSCLDTRYGSGVEATEARGVSEFSRIEIGGAAELVATVGPETSVIVRCDDNLLQYIRTEVRGSTLHVSTVSGSYQFEHGLEVEVTTPHLDSVSISGATRGKATGVDTDHFEAHISGAGKLAVSGQADTITGRVSGAGKLDLSQLTARSADVRVSGAGKLEVNVREALDARVSGAGNVVYAGSPSVSKNVSGAGSVSRK